jgi:hypothetical protein
MGLRRLVNCLKLEKKCREFLGCDVPYKQNSQLAGHYEIIFDNQGVIILLIKIVLFYFYR